MSDQKPPTDKLQSQQNEKVAESTGAPGSKKDGEEKKKLPQLGALEDDDEFEVRWTVIAYNKLYDGILQKTEKVC